MFAARNSSWPWFEVFSRAKGPWLSYRWSAQTAPGIAAESRT